MVPERDNQRGGMSALVVRLAFAAAGFFLVAGLALLAHAAARLIWPELLEGSVLLSYGRVFPAATALLLFGWLTLALVGYSFHAVPRLVGAPLAYPWLALGAVGLVAAGAGGGAALILLGESAGGRWLEFPLVVDGVLALGYAAVAALLVLTARGGDRQHLPLPAWFFVAGSVWLFLGHLIGAIPGFDGLASEIQSGFAGAAFFGLWAACAGLGVAYSVAGGVLGGGAFHERLGRIGFWSVSLTWIWTAARLLQNGPTNDWIETVPVVFGAGLVVAVLAVITDFGIALRGRWAEVKASPPLQMVVAGLGFLMVGVAASFVATLRSVSAVVQFTAWESGVETALLLGAFTLFALAGVALVAPAVRGKVWGRWWGRLVVWPVVAGTALAVFTRFAAGLQSGLSWLTGVQSGAYENANAGFGRSLEPLRGLDFVYLIGLGLVGMGAIGFLVRLLVLTIGRGVRTDDATSGFVSQPLSALLRGALAVFALAAIGAFALPAIDSDAEASVLAASTRDLASDPVAQLGREVYVREGCWYCHTQQVRQVMTDVGLGPVSQPGDYAYDPVGLAGSRRIGPDLTHQGSRENTGSAAWVRAHLADPRADHEWSVMPSFRYLNEAELTALSVYVSGLE